METEFNRSCWFRVYPPHAKNLDYYLKRWVHVTGRSRPYPFGTMHEIVLLPHDQKELGYTSPYLWVSDNHFEEPVPSFHKSQTIQHI